MPTDFRKKPIKFNQKFNFNNCKIESFEVHEIKLRSNGWHNKTCKSEVGSWFVDISDHVGIVEILHNGEWNEYNRFQEIRITKFIFWLILTIYCWLTR